MLTFCASACAVVAWGGLLLGQTRLSLGFSCAAVSLGLYLMRVRQAARLPASLLVVGIVVAALGFLALYVSIGLLGLIVVGGIMVVAALVSPLGSPSAPSQM